jgi:hypothetical protein
MKKKILSTVSYNQHSFCIIVSNVRRYHGVPMARIICTRTDINMSLASSCDVAAMLHLLELDRYNPRNASRSIASLVVLQRQNGDMFLPRLTPNGHVLATLESMSPTMAAHFISCREARRYKFHQHLHTENTLSTKGVLLYSSSLRRILGIAEGSHGDWISPRGTHGSDKCS